MVLENDEKAPAPRVNPGYAMGQIAKALVTGEEHPDSETRGRALRKISSWLSVLKGVVSGSIDAGTRAPLAGVPAWATLEVVTGGFATGELLAAGPLLDHERALLSELALPINGDARALLNAYFVTEAGIARLRDLLASGRYAIDVPEEGALLVVAWLLDNGHADSARAVLDAIGPFLGRLRFYPIPADQPPRFGSRIQLQDVAATIESLKKIPPNREVLAQKEAIEVWAPLLDQTVGLFLETVEGEPPFLSPDGAALGGWPCRRYPEGWPARAQALLDEYADKRSRHTLCGKPDRADENFPQLRAYLKRCLGDPNALTGRDVGRIRQLLARSMSRTGAPGSSLRQGIRERQADQVRAPVHHEIAKVVVARLEAHPRKQGIEDLDPVVQPITPEEAERYRLPASAAVPESLRHKVVRCLLETAEVLIERGVITSGETLARVLPQLSSGLHAAGIADPALNRLHASIYRAFRRRRSLLLLDLASQVKLEELPWIAAIEPLRDADRSARDRSREALREIAVLTLVSFPHAIVPNKLLQELRTLAKDAGLDLPLVDEIAVDIFMGTFSKTFVRAAKRAALLLEGSLYERYFMIDFAAIMNLAEGRPSKRFWRRQPSPDRFADLCAARAGVSLGGWDPAANGMIVEQQQILTTQNLAVLYAGLDLQAELRDRLVELAKECSTWVRARLTMKHPTPRALLHMLKNSAYAWRQMIFYLSFVSPDELRDFVAWAEGQLAEEPADLWTRFAPAWRGLTLAAAGRSMNDDAIARPFLGWSKDVHWLSDPKTKGREV